MLDVPVRVQDERLGADARREPDERLGGHRVQPREPVRPGHRDDSAVGQVDGGEALGEQPLLAHRVAVVPGDPGIDSLGRHRTGGVEKG